MFGVTMVLFATVRANGAVVAPLMILVIALFPVRLGLRAIGAAAELGADALWWSFPSDRSASLAMAIAYYRYGGWRRRRVAAGRPRARSTSRPRANPPPSRRRWRLICARRRKGAKRCR